MALTKPDDKKISKQIIRILFLLPYLFASFPASTDPIAAPIGNIAPWIDENVVESRVPISYTTLGIDRLDTPML